MSRLPRTLKKVVLSSGADAAHDPGKKPLFETPQKVVASILEGSPFKSQLSGAQEPPPAHGRPPKLIGLSPL